MSASDFPYLPAAGPANRPHVEDELHRTIVAELLATYRKTMDEFEQAFLGDVEHWKPRGILVPAGRDPVAPEDAAEEMRWHGDAYVMVHAPTRTTADPSTLEQRLAEAIAELEAPVDPRVWATTPEPCARPAAVEPPPLRWSRPLRMWP